MIDIAHLREEYMRERLDERDAARDPLAQFRAWFDEAVRARLPMVNAMTLATVAAHGRPAARIVLLKGLDERGFVFYTHYESRKGRELAAHPRAALVLYWIELERQVRIEGTVERTAPEASDAYYATRPLGSRLAVHAAVQSTPVDGRSVLEQGYADAEARYGSAPSRPPAWGGYRVVPDAIEFWQGRPNRLHDRLLYTRRGEAWDLVRLAP